MDEQTKTIIDSTNFGEIVVDGSGNPVKVSSIFDGFSDKSILFFDPVENIYNVIDPVDKMVYCLDGRDDTFGEILASETGTFASYMPK